MSLRFLLVAQALALSSCGPGDEALEPATPECLVGVWQQSFLSEDGTMTACPRCLTDPPTATDECEQTDCAEALILIFTDDGLEVGGRWRWSEGTASMTIPGRCPLTLLPSRVDEPGIVLIDNPGTQPDTEIPLECASSRLVIGGDPRDEYTRAPDGFAAAALRMVGAGECSTSYEPP